jgi:tricorn protease
MKKLSLLWILSLAAGWTCLGQSQPPLLLQAPALSKTQIAFAYGGQIWVVGRDGGAATRLVSGAVSASGPIFSPDGEMLAYTGDYDGNLDVYVVPATGGEPRRLTYHPAPDVALGWTPDGKQILFRSPSASATDGEQLYTVPVTGGFPTELPLPIADQASYSPDGSRVAYVPGFQWQPAWKGYRGGQTTPIWIANLSDLSIVKVPRDNSTDKDPMWIGNKIYFLSDREGPVTLFVYDIETRQVTRVLKNDGLDLKSASAGPGAIVYEQFGSLHLYNLDSGESKRVDVQIAADLPQLRPHFEKVDPRQLQHADISPSGKRAVFEAHGEILTVPAEKGDVRNITNSPAVEDRDPAWSPDGKTIAYFSDESGEYALHLRDQSGIGEVRKISLGNPPSFFYSPTWSPDSNKIAYSDKRLNLWYVDLANPTPVRVDTDLFDSPLHEFDAQWSPDSRLLTYTRQLPNHFHAVFVYSLETHKSTQLTDGMSDALYPNFDKNGKYLYFTASTDLALSTGWLDMTAIGHPITRSAYVVVLKKDLPSPLPPESDDEKAKEPEKEGSDAAPAAAEAPKEKDKDKTPKGEPKPKPVKVEIDFENIGQRVLALPIPAGNYGGLSAGKEGQLFLAEQPVVDVSFGPPHFSVQKFDLKTRKTDKLLDGLSGFVLSSDGEKMLYAQGEKWFVAGTGAPPKPGEGMLNTAGMEVFVDPRAEWRQMYHEVWRIERDFLYDPHFHGLDLAAAEKGYAKYLDGIASRSGLNYLFEEMTGNITLGHTFIRGGTQPKVERVQVGLLGADYKIENGRYRFTRIYDGENWNPELHAPLTQPGVNVKTGEYLLAVNGRDLRASDNIYSFFQETAGKQTILKVGPNPGGAGSRDVTVIPVPDEEGLRNLAWVENNRRKVDELSGGRVAYVHLPDTADGGFRNFNRYYFAQVGKEAAVIDERFNHGGDIADYIIENLRRPIMSFVMSREGETQIEPAESIYGPKVMIINQFSGSGGDALPWYFRKAGLGPLIGMKTWGGLVGISGYPVLMDGGRVTAPRWAIYGTEGDWEVENRGIAPDYEVEMDPKLVREGHDPQLEKAVQVVLELLAKNPPKKYSVPPYPVYHHPLPPAGQEH